MQAIPEPAAGPPPAATTVSRRILVTGASGLVAGELLALFAQGPDSIVPLGRRPSGLANYYACDLGDPAATLRALEAIRPQAVVHLAGGSAGDRHQLYRSNVLSTVHLLEAAAGLPQPPYCLVFGSAAEYGEVSSAPITEDSALRPVTEYGRAKVAQTTLAETIAADRGLPLTILRPFNLVSPRLAEHTALGSMRQQLLAGSGPARTVRCGRLDVVRDFIPASLAAEAARRLLERPAPGRVLNVCSGVGIELGAVLAAMARELGVELEVEPDARLVALPAAPRVVGDPGALRSWLGLECEPNPQSLAALLLGAGASPPSSSFGR